MSGERVDPAVEGTYLVEPLLRVGAIVVVSDRLPVKPGTGLHDAGQPWVLPAAGVQRCHHRPAAHELFVGTTYRLGTGVPDRLPTALTCYRV